MITLLAFVFVLGVLVFVHELGHFLAAKRVGIRVLKFQLGFNPTIVSFRRGDTEYGIASTAFLEYAFRTDSYELTVTFNADGSWSYVSDTMLTVRGRDEPFRHRDRNTLVKVGEPTPNPLALIRASTPA